MSRLSMVLWLALAPGCGIFPLFGGKDAPDESIDDRDDPPPPGPPDRDGDGLSDAEEAELGTDPDDADTDDDGLRDGSEIEEGTDPLHPDPDGDGLLDGEEVFFGTDPYDPDTDDDGLSDHTEADGPTDPLLADTDGDGLDDATEVLGATDPLVADTDGDGLSDGDEVDVHGTEPTVEDTDGDGLNDGDEVVVQGTDPTLADTDADLLDDADELVAGTDPLVPDTDADLLLDGEEVVLGTDPLVFDTDGGGVGDGDELDDGTDPLDPADDDPCGYPTSSIAPLVPGAPALTAEYLGVAWTGLFDGGWHDHTDDTDGDGVAEDQPTEVVFEIFDAVYTRLCTVRYEPVVTPVPPLWPTPTGTLTEAYALTLANAVTDCGPLDAARYGTADPIQFVENRSWGIGHGVSSVAFSSAIEQAVNAGGGDFTTDWEPYLMSGFVSPDGGGGAIEMNTLTGTEVDCAGVVIRDGNGDATGIGKVGGPVPIGTWSAQSYIVFVMDAL